MKLRTRINDRTLDCIRDTHKRAKDAHSAARRGRLAEAELSNEHVATCREDAIKLLENGSLAGCFSALKQLGADPQAISTIMLLRNSLGPQMVAALLQLHVLAPDEPIEFDAGVATIKVSIELHDSESDQEE